MDNVNSISLWNTRSDAGQTSRAIWENMRRATPYEVATDCNAEYTANFYNGLVDFHKLVPHFIKNRENFIFNYADFIASMPGSLGVPAFPSANSPILPEPGPPIAFRYINSKSEMVQAQLSASLNKRVCYIDRGNQAYNIEYNSAKGRFNCAIKFYYEGTQDFRTAITLTEQENDFAIDPKYAAVIITTNSITDFIALAALLDGPGQINYLKKELARVYAKKLSQAKSTGELKKLYENMPAEIVGHIKDFIAFETLYSHISVLCSEDDTGILSWLADSSSAMINLFAAMGNMQTLYKRLTGEPQLVKRIFNNLDGHSATADGLVPNKIIFSNLLRALCVSNGFDGAEKHSTVFTYGTGHKINGNAVIEDDTEKRTHSYYLEQIAVTALEQGAITTSSPTTMAPTGSYTQNSNKTVHSGHYGPLDMVYLATPGSDVPMAVPALCVKALAHEDERQDIERNIRFGANLFAIVLGIATLGAASPLLVALAVADIALSTADIVVMSLPEDVLQSEEGRAFTEVWDKIMLAGGIATAGPLLIKGMLTAGGKIIAKNPDLLAAIAGQMVRAIERAENFTTFVKGSITVVIDYSRLAGLAYKMGRLQEYGVLLLKGQLKLGNTGGDGYALLYKGEIIAEGSYSDIYKSLDDIFTRSLKSSIAEVLDDFFDISKIDAAIAELKIKDIPVSTLSPVRAQRRLKDIIKTLSKNKRIVFNPEKEALRKLGIKLPKSKTGLSVDFEGTPYLYPAKGNEKAIVKIKLTFDDVKDKMLANKLANFKRTPKGYTWHHLDDYNGINGTCVMQLVETKIHQAAVPHYGSVKIAEEFLNVKYITRKNG